MFATHGLVPGDLINLTQPALALSNPKIVEENEDGLLMLTEILGLKLQAEWVVLSHAIPHRPTARHRKQYRALGVLFSLPVRRLLLVSHWPVDTVLGPIADDRAV